MCSRVPASLMTPFDWSIDFHICAATTVGIAHGTSITARMTPRPLKFELTTRAMASPSANSKHDGDERELHRRPDGVAEDRVVERSLVVLEPDPARRLEREELLVGEALEDRLAERVERDERDDRERRQEQHPGEPRLPALELRRLAPAAGGGCWGRRRSTSSGGGGWQMPSSPDNGYRLASGGSG